MKCYRVSKTYSDIYIKVGDSLYIYESECDGAEASVLEKLVSDWYIGCGYK